MTPGEVDFERMCCLFGRPWPWEVFHADEQAQPMPVLGCATEWGLIGLGRCYEVRCRMAVGSIGDGLQVSEEIDPRVLRRVYWGHAWNLHRNPILAAAVVFLVVIGAHACGAEWFGAGWWPTADAVVTLATLLVAIVVWIGGLQEEWKRGRPNRISVQVVKDGVLLASCQHAPLLGDPRAYAQQIAAQMLEEKYLTFVPVIEGVVPALVPYKGDWVQHQSVTLELKDLPPGKEGVLPVTWTEANGWGRKANEPSKRYIANAFSLSMLEKVGRHSLVVEPVGAEQARQLAADAESVVGHEATCEIFSKELGRQIPLNRASIRLAPGEEVLIGQYDGPRLDVGTSVLPEAARIQWFLLKVGRFT